MNASCGSCKYGRDTKPDGGKTSPGTAWCSQRNLQMGKSRQMPCYIASGGKVVNHCASCKRGKTLIPTGGAPRFGTVWCDKRHLEINKQLTMDCFEK